MVETTVVLKPESEWRTVPRWYSNWPAPARWLFSYFAPEHMTFEELQEEMNERLRFPGIPNIWTMPIKNRIDMLSTGVRTPIGIKILGSDLKVIQQTGEELENIFREISGTRSVLAERTAGGYYVDFVLNRDELARYGLSVADAQAIVTSAIGGDNVTTTVEGRERYPVSVRYGREFRQNVSGLRLLRPGPHHVVHRRGGRRDEADRRADDRRPLHVVHHGASRLPGHLSSLARARSAAFRACWRRATNAAMVASHRARERVERRHCGPWNRRLRILPARRNEAAFPTV